MSPVREQCLFGLAGGALLSGCFLSPLPDARTPADRAREIEPKCRGVSDVAPPLSPDAIDDVEPSYSYVGGGPNGREARFRGARIRLRPATGMSRESIVRVAECHQANVLLGRVPQSDSDPYALPDRWLSIDAESDGDGFAVLVRSDRIEDARRVLERARAFAHARPGE